MMMVVGKQYSAQQDKSVRVGGDSLHYMLLIYFSCVACAYRGLCGFYTVQYSLF